MNIEKTLNDIKEYAELLDKYRALEKENENLKIEIGGLMWERDGLKIAVEKLKEENQTLELWLDNKEKLNEEYRKQLDKYKAQYEHSMDVELNEEWLYD